MKPRAYVVYVLETPAGRYYIGLTEDLEKRLGQHNAGVSRWTRGKGPWRAVWSRHCDSLGEARKLESFLKGLKGGQQFYAYTGLVRRPGS